MAVQPLNALRFMRELEHPEGKEFIILGLMGLGMKKHNDFRSYRDQRMQAMVAKIAAEHGASEKITLVLRQGRPDDEFDAVYFPEFAPRDLRSASDVGDCIADCMSLGQSVLELAYRYARRFFAPGPKRCLLVFFADTPVDSRETVRELIGEVECASFVQLGHDSDVSRFVAGIEGVADIALGL